MRTKKSDWSQLWKRNAVVRRLPCLFCAAVYLKLELWQGGRHRERARRWGQSTMVGGKTQDPLVGAAAPRRRGPTRGCQTGGEVQTSGETEDKGGAYFATARLNRQQARDSALSLFAGRRRPREGRPTRR